LVAAPLAGVGGAWAWNTASADTVALADVGAAEQYRVSIGRCIGPIRTTCVVDGDTFWLEGTKIRIADINTPEVSEPKCPSEAALGERATDRLVVLLNDGGFSLSTIDRDEDKYGRKLRIVTRGGESLGTILVDEGLAERWTGSRRNWC
jgi:endonuclease YncB( thermonuclease family)